MKETLVLICLESHFDIIESWKLIVGHRDIYYAKNILNSFDWVEVRILVEKWNINEAHKISHNEVCTKGFQVVGGQ